MNDDGSPQSGPMSKPNGADSNDPDGIICEVKTRLGTAISAESDNYKNMADDLNFLKGDQWPEKQRRSRESDGRVVLTINKIPTFLQQVTNDQRQNRANMKVSPTSEDAEQTTAEIIQGMIKHMEYVSAADSAYDTAANSAAAVGLGYWRLKTEYESDTSFNQVIRIKRIRNIFTVHIDPSSVEADGSDMQWAVISERMTKDEFKAKYPRATATLQGFTISGPGDNQNKHWLWANEVRVAEYYRMGFTPGTLYQYGDGKTEFFPHEDTEKDVSATPMSGQEPAPPEGEEVAPSGPPAGVQIVNKRDTVQRKIMWYLLTPYEVLESTEIKCKWIPVFPVYGTEIDVDGKVYRAGLIRNAKDPAMMYNFWMTSATEEVSMRTKTPWVVAEGQLEGHENKWKQANSRTFPYLEYKPTTVDGVLAPAPQRQQMADVPVGVLAMAAHASDNIKQTTGLFDSSLGATGNATSGKQEIAQQRQGNIANFHYMDNFFRSLRHAGRCIVDMIPHYYDAQRMVTCRGMDGEAKPATINKWDEAAQRFINDVRVGQYDIAIDPGPSHSTMRAEAADALIQISQKWPKLMEVAGDKVMKALTIVGGDEIAERLKKTIPANLMEGEDGNEQPTIPPEVEQKLAQLEEALKQAQEDADDNRTKLAIETSRSKTTLEKALIDSDSRKDVEELKGMVQLLLAHIQPPPALAEDVSKDLTQDDTRDPGGEASAPVNNAPDPSSEY